MKKENEDGETTTTIFVTFENSYAMRIIAGLNDPSFSSKLRYYITCCQAGNRYKFEREGQKFDITIERAPEPEDVIWTNLGYAFGFLLCRKVITYIVTLCLLGASFGAVYGLSIVQIKNEKSTAISVLISLVISIINVIIGGKLCDNFSGY